MIVPKYSANYRLSLRSKRHAVQIPGKCDIFSRKKCLGFEFFPVIYKYLLDLNIPYKDQLNQELSSQPDAHQSSRSQQGLTLETASSQTVQVCLQALLLLPSVRLLALWYASGRFACSKQTRGRSDSLRTLEGK
jgi:hypothetical protein